MTFKVGQKVVYPNHGVSLVEKIEAAQMEGIEQICYHLRLLANNSKVMIPKTNLDLVGLRESRDRYAHHSRRQHQHPQPHRHAHEGQS